MSTRGAVAIKTDKGWRGVYNHFDSYPDGLGREVWVHLKTQVDSLKEFATGLLATDDWRNYLGGGLCEYCGKRGLGQPHTINGEVAYSKSEGFADPEAKHHKHGDLSDKITHDTGDPLFIEYVYVIDADKKTMTILTGVRQKGYTEEKSHDGSTFKSPNYGHVEVETVSLEGNEPDWEALDQKAGKIREQAHANCG